MAQRLPKESSLVARRVPKVIAGGMKCAQGHRCRHEGCSKVIVSNTKGAQSHHWQRSSLAAQGCPKSSLGAQVVHKVISGGTRGAQVHCWQLKRFKIIAGGTKGTQGHR